MRRNDKQYTKYSNTNPMIVLQKKLDSMRCCPYILYYGNVGCTENQC